MMLTILKTYTNGLSMEVSKKRKEKNRKSKVIFELKKILFLNTAASGVLTDY